jgi:hypothetical protein
MTERSIKERCIRLWHHPQPRRLSSNCAQPVSTIWSKEHMPSTANLHTLSPYQSVLHLFAKHSCVKIVIAFDPYHACMHVGFLREAPFLFSCLFRGLVPPARVCVWCLWWWPWGPASFWFLLRVVAFLCFDWCMLLRGFSASAVFCVGLCCWVGSLGVPLGFLLAFLPLPPFPRLSQYHACKSYWMAAGHRPFPATAYIRQTQTQFVYTDNAGFVREKPRSVRTIHEALEGSKDHMSMKVSGDLQFTCG